MPDTRAIVTGAVEDAVKRCPSCPRCPEVPRCPSCPACQAGTTSCPACTLSCPKPEPDAVVAGRHRLSMLQRPQRNIIECAPGQDCRMAATARHKVLGQKGVTLWMTGLSGSGKTTISEALEKKLLLGLGKNVDRDV